MTKDYYTKEERADYNRHYHRQNADRINARKRERRHNNLDAARLQAKIYYEKNHVHIKEIKKQWYIKNRPRILADAKAQRRFLKNPV